MEEAKILTEDRDLSYYAEQVISELGAWLSTLGLEGTKEEIWEKNKKKLNKLVANWIINRLLKLVSENNIEISKIKINPENFAEFIVLVYQNKISSKSAQQVLEKMFKSGTTPSHIIEEEGLEQVSNENELTDVVEKTIKNNPQVVEDYKKGKSNALQFLIGKIMKETKGKANPQAIAKLLKEKI